MIDVLRLHHAAAIGSWALLAGAAGYLAYHFVLVGQQYLRIVIAF